MFTTHAASWRSWVAEPGKQAGVGIRWQAPDGGCRAVLVHLFCCWSRVPALPHRAIVSRARSLLESSAGSPLVHSSARSALSPCSAHRSAHPLAVYNIGGGREEEKGGTLREGGMHVYACWYSQTDERTVGRTRKHTSVSARMPQVLHAILAAVYLRFHTPLVLGAFALIDVGQL